MIVEVLYEKNGDAVLFIRRINVCACIGVCLCVCGKAVHGMTVLLVIV